MHSFAYKNGTLYCENVNLQELADKCSATANDNLGKVKVFIANKPC